MKTTRPRLARSRVVEPATTGAAFGARRWALVLACLIVVGFGAAGAMAAGDWGSPSEMNKTDSSPCPCGGVNGIVGCIQTYPPSTTAGVYESKADIGAKWWGQQYHMVQAPEPVLHDNHLAHVYNRDPTQGAPSNKYLIADAIQKFMTDGSAQELQPDNPVSWWWDTVAKVKFLGVSVEYFDQNSQSWQPAQGVTWKAISGGGPFGGGGKMDATGKDSPNNNQPGPPPGYQPPQPPDPPEPAPREHSLPGQTAGTTQETWNGYADTSACPHATIRVIAKTHSEARPSSVDNAKVNDMKIYMELKLKSKMSSSPPQWQPGG